MKQVQPVQNEEMPLVKDSGHIYNTISEEGFGILDFGWARFEFELHAGLKYQDHDVDGLTLFDECKIKLEMSLSDSEARETIMHEIFHVMLESVGLDERLYDGEFVKTTNEQLANTLGKQMRQFDRLNPGFLAILYPYVQTTTN